MSAPEIIRELAETFAANLDAYKSGGFNEAQVRIQFINPLLEALGWDVSNRAGYAEAYKDVIHEDSLRIGGAVKAPDYSCRIGGARKFFIEAKKPSVNIREDIHPAYQLRRYAWSAKLPLSILTDFEEFAVYDCRVKPVKTDKASRARILYMRFEEYGERWDEIAGVFAREAILKGSFDKYAASHKRRGTAEVDAAFLAEIERWRDQLAKNIALRNAALSQRELNHAVQQTIDRLIFLRIAEDRGIEDYGRLMALQNGGETYKRMLEMFHAADARYNSGLFHFSNEKGRAGFPDEITPGIAIDDKALKPILASLYYPDSPYEFSVLPADILGQVYEQFLGKVIRLTAGHRAVVEDKPEVKKAGGVYYTPTYIVDYIVRHTVGKLLEGKTVRQAANVRICDPACGSGSFLLGAYQYLLDWHLKWYVDNDSEKWSRGREPKIFQFIKDDWRLTTAEKKRILLNNIYGVDIDAQAVEVTKLSLLLKVLEHETGDTLGRQLSMFHERALPDLGHNIKCGNSLIGPDFYDQQELSLLDDDTRQRINVFDWQTEFPAIFTSGGFDAVIGNPPYIRVHRLDEPEKNYYWVKYNTFVAKADIYACFIQKGIQLLCAKGMLAFITPNTWASLESFTNLRKHVLANTFIEEMVRTPTKVFRNATVRTFIFVLRRRKEREKNRESVFVREISEKGDATDVGLKRQDEMEAAHLSNLLLNSSESATNLFDNCLRRGARLGEILEFKYGFKSGDDDRFIASESLSEFHEPFVRSADISRYARLVPSEFVDYRPEVMKANKKTARPGDRSRFIRPKIIVARMGHQLIAAYDDNGLFVKDAMLLLSPSNSRAILLAVVGLLNSRFLQYLYQNFFSTIDILKNALLALPVPTILSDGDNASKLITLVERMLELHRQLAVAKTSHEKTSLQRQIDATDRQIDKLVYKLYELTDEEIAIVEESSTTATN